jgi:PilZ domain
MTKPGEESRRRKRVPLALSGHYVLESGCNYPCQTENVSATGILLRGFPGGDLGEWVVVYLSELGRIEGTIVRSEDTCFAFEIAATPSQTQKLAAKLASLSSQSQPLRLPDDGGERDRCADSYRRCPSS